MVSAIERKIDQKEEFGKLGVELLNQKKVALWEFHQELKEHPTMNVPLWKKETLTWFECLSLLKMTILSMVQVGPTRENYL